MYSIDNFKIMIVMFVSFSGISADTGSAISDGGQRADSGIYQLQQVINQESMLRLTLDKQLQELRSVVYGLKSKTEQLEESCQIQIPRRLNSAESEFRSLVLNLTKQMDEIQLNLKRNISDNENELDSLRQYVLNANGIHEKLNHSYQILNGQTANKLQILRENILDLQMNVSSSQGLIDKVEDNPVYFSAFLRNQRTTQTSYEIIKFNDVTVNEGAGYNPSTGKFTCPMDGVYLLSFGFMSDVAKHMDVYMYINGIVTIQGVTPGDIRTNSAERTTVHTLKKGDEVYVKVVQQGSSLFARKYTSFSAVCLH